MSQEGSPRSVIAASLFLALLAYGGGLALMVYAQAGLMKTHSLQATLIFSEMALASPAIIAALLLARWIPELYRFAPLGLWAVLKIFAVGLAFWALSLGVFEAQFVFVKPPLAYLEQFQGLHDMLRPRDPFGWLLSIAAIAVAPAVGEEILFRGLITPVLRRAAGPIAAIVVSSALFALIHVDAMPDGTRVYYRVLFAFVLGALLAKLRIDTQSLWPPMIAHATLNATTFLVVFLVEEPKGVLPEPQPLVALGMLLVGSTVARMLMRQVRAKPSGG